MFARRIKRLIAGLAVLLPLATLAYYLAFMLRFDGQLAPPADALLLSSLGWVLAVKAGALLHAQLHLDFNRYVTFRDMVLLARTATVSSIGIALVDTMVLSGLTIPRSVIVLDWCLSLVLLGGVRTVPRLIRDFDWQWLSPTQGTIALIVGADDAGEMLLRSIRQHPGLNYQAIGFVDPRPEVQGRRIAGVPVLGTHEDLAELARQRNVEEILITADSLPGKQLRSLIEAASGNDLRVKVLPSYDQLLHERVAINPRPVAITDLLRRPSVELDTDRIQDWVRGRTILVTGSAGSIGSEICRQLLKLSPQKLVVVDRTETGQFFLERELRDLAPQIDIQVALADLNDRNRLKAIFSEFRPEIVFHAAAYKHVPLMEQHVGEAIKNIVLATRHVVDLAEEFEAEGFVMISTDKAVNPTSVMGSCKRLAEEYVQAKASTSRCRLVTVRFGNVLDSAGSVVPIFRRQIATGGPVTVTHPDMVRYFMLIPEAAQLVIQAGAMGQGGEIFVLDMGEPVRIMDLAKDMIRLSGLRVGDDIEIEVTGLRSGEKLFEELYSEKEQHRPTAHAKIRVAVGEPRNLLSVINNMGQLAAMLDEPNETLRSALAEVVPLTEQPANHKSASVLQQRRVA